LVLWLAASALVAQTDFDRKLESLYRYSVPLISPSTLQGWIDSGKKFVLLDTRSHEEFSVSHLKDAKLLEFGKMRIADMKGFDRGVPVVVYCSVGYRSERVGEQLQKAGYTTVVNLYGGIFQWKNEGRVVVNFNNKPTDSVHTFNKSWARWLTNGTKVY